MKLVGVTITGASDDTCGAAMEKMSERYQFVEWGLLLSVEKSDFSARFPSLRKLSAIGGINSLRTSVHLCGRLAREAASGVRYAYHTARTLVPNARRVQLNLGGNLDSYPDLFQDLVAQRVRTPPGLQVIIQAYSLAAPTVYPARGIIRGSAVFLQDGSGGAGLRSPFQPPPNGGLIGYAGGITPENLEDVFQEIFALEADNDFWIDIESGVRTTADRLDLKKVERVLEISASHITL